MDHLTTFTPTANLVSIPDGVIYHTPELDAAVRQVGGIVNDERALKPSLPFSARVDYLLTRRQLEALLRG